MNGNQSLRSSKDSFQCLFSKIPQYLSGRRRQSDVQPGVGWQQLHPVHGVLHLGHKTGLYSTVCSTSVHCTVQCTVQVYSVQYRCTHRVHPLAVQRVGPGLLHHLRQVGVLLPQLVLQHREASQRPRGSKMIIIMKLVQFLGPHFW